MARSDLFCSLILKGRIARAPARIGVLITSGGDELLVTAERFESAIDRQERILR